MSLFFDIAEFKTTTSAINTTIDVTLSLGGLAPKAIWVFTVGRTDAVGANGVGAGDINFSYGFAVSPTKRRAINTHAMGVNATTSADRRFINSGVVFSCAASTGSTNGTLDVNDMSTADKVQFIVDQVFSDDLKCIVAAIAGTDITAADIIDFNKSSTTTGLPFTVNTTSLSFAPKYLEIIGIENEVAFPQSVTRSIGFLGRALPANALNQILNWFHDDGQATIDTSSYSNNLHAFVTNSGTTSLITRARIIAQLSNGFTTEYLENSDTTARTMSVLALGGTFQVAFEERESIPPPDATISIGPGFVPLGGLVISACRAASADDTVSATAEVSMGAFTGPQATGKSLSQGYIDVDNVAASASQAATATRFQDAYVNISSSAAVEGSLGVDNAHAASSGELFFIQNVEDVSSSFLQFVVFGEAPAVTAHPTPGYRHRRKNYVQRSRFW